MNYGSRPGWIEVISGVMFSGKSEELIRRVRRAIIARRRVQVFKSHLDSRYTGLYSVSSHDGTELDASPVDSAAEIFRLVRPDTQLVAIDEAQFLDPDIVTVATLARGPRRARDPGRHRHRLPGRAVRLDGRPDGRRRDRGQAPGHLRRVRRSGLPQPAAGRRQAGALRLAHDHGGRPRELRGALPALPPGAAARTRTRPRSSSTRPGAPAHRCSTSPSPATSPPGSPPSPSCSGRWGATVIDADRLVRDAQAPGSPGASGHRRPVRARTCSTRSGALDRAALRRASWAIPRRSPISIAIVHPEVLRRRAALEHEARERGDRIVVSDIPAALRGRRPVRVRRRRAGGRAASRSGGPGSWPQRGLSARGRRPDARGAGADRAQARAQHLRDRQRRRPRRARSARARGLDAARRAGRARARLTSPATAPILPRATPDRERPCRTSLTTCVYTPEHEYVARTGDADVVRVGITDYAQGELGDVVFVNLPKLGAAARRRMRRSARSRRSRRSRSCTARWPVRWSR